MENEDDRKTKAEEKPKPRRPQPVTRKTGEPEGNLRKREEWFRKRAGS